MYSYLSTYDGWFDRGGTIRGVGRALRRERRTMRSSGDDWAWCEGKRDGSLCGPILYHQAYLILQNWSKVENFKRTGIILVVKCLYS